MDDQLLHRQITEQIIGSAMEVHSTLGSGFLEKVYENALAAELRVRGLRVEQQKRITVFYKDVVVGDYFADLVVENLVIVELKTAEVLSNAHLAQLLNYLRATKINVGLVLNFHGRSLEWKRQVLQTAL